MKVSTAQRLLRSLQEKQAGIMLPLAAGAAVLGGAQAIRKGLQKSHEYKAGFYPGYMPQEH